MSLLANLFGRLFGRGHKHLQGRRTIAELEAYLSAHNGFAGIGEAEIEAKLNGQYVLVVEVDSAVSGTGDVFIEGVRLGSVNLNNGEFKATYAKDARPVAFAHGHSVEVKQGDTVILSGVFARSKPD
jgi:hypothetical protein